MSLWKTDTVANVDAFKDNWEFAPAWVLRHSRSLWGSLMFSTSRGFPHWTETKTISSGEQIHQTLAHVQVKRALWVELWVRDCLAAWEIQVSFLLKQIRLHFYLSVCRWWDAHATVCMWRSEDSVGVGSLLPPRGTWVPNMEGSVSCGSTCVAILYLFLSVHWHPGAPPTPGWQSLNPKGSGLVLLI